MSQPSPKHPPSHDPVDPAAAARILQALDEPERPEADPDHESPIRIPGYTIHERLGEGAGGHVHRASRDGIGGSVAIKILRKRLGSLDGKARERLWRELDLHMQTRLPALPRMLDYGEDCGHLYFITEYIDGLSLDQYCRRHKLDRRARVDLLARVCEAVHTLHERGIIHRDLKPSNILITRAGDPFIIDLGVAMLLADDVMETLTADGTPIGTPAFMAPEQARGEHNAITTRSDVYAIGAIGYQLLTGSTPHDMTGTLHSTIARVAGEPARDPRELDSSLDRAISAVLAKACAREPARRYASAADLAADLQRWMKREPVTARPPGAWQRAAKWVGRHPVVTTACLCITLLIMTVASSYFYFWWWTLQPSHVEVDHVRREAVLLDRNGRVLKRWRSNTDHHVQLAQEIELPDSLGGGRGVAALVRQEVLNPEYSDRLCIWSFRNLQAPVWFTPTDPPRIRPPREPVLGDTPYYVADALMADIFPELAGMEIVALHNQAMSPSAIRIYSVRGDLLFEVWHRGTMSHAHWLSGPRRLIVMALDNRHKWFVGDPINEVVYARCLFSVTPRLNLLDLVLNDEPMAANVTPDWYRYFDDPTLFYTHSDHDRLMAPEIESLRPDHVEVGIYSRHHKGFISFLVDQYGQMDGVVATDTLLLSAESSPLLSIQLTDEPPRPRGGAE